jgi:hypothetical protein
MRKGILVGLLASACVAAGAGGWMSVRQAAAADDGIKIVPDDIGGVVKSSKGPEAGVWVIAETKDLPNRFVKIVVTDDEGRYVLPELPKAKYKVWVRGYGLTDSQPVETEPGKRLDLTAIVAPDPKAAAEYYPANYWYALLQPPPASDFPGTGKDGNGISIGMKSQQQWLGHMKENCLFCHQLGDKSTRELLTQGNSVEAWAERIQKARADGDVTLGNHGKELSAQMQNMMAAFGRQRGLKMYADWTDRIAGGALPQVPPRPKGVERNVVVTAWDWADGRFVHDEATTDKRNPTVNSDGPIYGVDTLNDHLEMLDPNTGKSTELDIPGQDPSVKHSLNNQVHNPMLDGQGRVWMTMLPGSGEGAQESWCTDGKEDKYAAYFPLNASAGRKLAVYDPKSKQIQIIPVCFSTHHINFGHDKDNTLYFSGDVNALGWIDTKVWDETHDAKKATGWCPFVLDTSGDGKIDADRNNWNQPSGNPFGNIAGEGAKQGGDAAEPAKAADPHKDTRISGFPYGMNVSPTDDAVWVAKYTPAVPSGVMRVTRGSNPPETCKTEYYEPPKLPDGTYAAFNARGVDVDSKGIAWVAFGSGHLGRFDRSKCKVTNGPTATGQQCPEGWEIFPAPEPKVAGTNMPSGWYYLTYVDLHNVFGLGKDVPILPGSETDSLLAFLPDQKKWIEMRVPYPMGYYPRGMDVRIDQGKPGWKGHAIWTNNGTTPLWHQETGEGSYGEVVKFQLRPNPLAS